MIVQYDIASLYPEVIERLSKRIADLRAEANEIFCTCDSYDCYGECCGVGNCSCSLREDTTS